MPPFFAGHWFDRMDPVRGDEAQFASAREHPDARLLCLNGLDPALDEDGRLTYTNLDGGAPLVLLGMIDDTPTFAGIAGQQAAPRSRAIFGLLERLHPADAPVYAAARSVIDWHVRHGFCAACGHATGVTRAGWGRHCGSCGADHFPRVDPVAIMLAQHDGRVLIGRQPQYPPGRYSALAGFIEPGESIEDAVARELHEEAGVHVTAVRYFASQPWPFPSSLMIGCIADVAGDQLTLDTTEIEDAFWVDAIDVAGALADVPGARFIAPPRYAIARDLLEGWLAGFTPAS